MHYIYVLLFTLLLSTFLATTVDVLVATGSSTQLRRIKPKVIFHTFAAPMILALVILVVILTDNKAFNIFFSVGIIIGSLIRAFFGDRKYVTSLQVDNQQLNIEYLTPLLKSKRISFTRADLSDIEIEKANWLIDFPASLNIKYKDEVLAFYIIDKQLKGYLQTLPLPPQRPQGT